MDKGSFDIDTAGLEYFYNPRSIAIVGASNHAQKPGGKPLGALLKRGYAGKIFPVNPRYEEVAGIECYPSLLDVPDEVDMAIISVPAESVLEVLQQCVGKGVKAVVIFSAGFSEVGGEGKALQDKVRDLARANDIRVLGPNCLGLINSANAVAASFAYIVDLEPIQPGTLAFVTQSGAFGAMMYDQATAAGIGFSSFTSVGNEADAEFADFVTYLLDTPETQVIGGYLEGAKDGAKLRRAAEKALALQKPMLILKVGRTGAGARAASSHTGSLAGDDQIYDAFFRQMGIVRIEALGDLTAFSILHRSGRAFPGHRVAVLSGSGGQGVLLADKCERLGLSVPEITGPTREYLEQCLPDFASARNPIDLTAQAGRDPSIWGKCLRALVNYEGIDVVLAQAFFHDDNGLRAAKELVEIYESTSKPIVLMRHGRSTSEVVTRCFEMIAAAKIPVLWDGLQAAEAIAKLVWYQDRVTQRKESDAEPPQPRILPGEGVDALIRSQGQLSEFHCKQILNCYGIPVTRESLATSADIAVAQARELGYPVALKIQSGQILHKTEAGGIRLNLGSDQEVRAAYDEVLANAKRFAPRAELDGVLIQEMLTEGVEVIIGTTKDPVFGHVIMFGLGGIFVEALEDVSFRIAPVTRGDAEEMIREIKGYRVLQGIRGKPPVDIDAIVDAILRVSQLVTDYPEEIEELDINPLLVSVDGARAIDALVTRRRRPTRAMEARLAGVARVL
jgi:acetyltransferase